MAGAFTAAIHHGGTVDKDSSIVPYVGGATNWYDNCDSDRFSLHDIHQMCWELGIYDFLRFYYMVPGNEQEGLNLLTTDDDVRDLYTSACASPNKYVDIYVEHGILEVIPLAVDNVPPRNNEVPAVVVIDGDGNGDGDEERDVPNDNESARTGPTTQRHRKPGRPLKRTRRIGPEEARSNPSTRLPTSLTGSRVRQTFYRPE